MSCGILVSGPGTEPMLLVVDVQFYPLDHHVSSLNVLSYMEESGKRGGGADDTSNRSNAWW